MLKIIATTKPPKSFYRIGEDFNSSLWYDFSKVVDVGAKTGDEVEIEFETKGKDRILTAIKVVGTAPPKTTNTKSPDKGVDINNSIRKQAVGKMVPETLKAMDLTGLSIVDIEPIIKSLFNTYDELTK